MFHHKFEYINNLNIDPRLIGFEATLSPFACNNSAPRADMWSSHIKQALVLDGAEFPYIFTGWEHNLGQYEFSKSRRNQDAQILAVIPKYAAKIGKYKVGTNPSILVIWVGNNDRTIYYSMVETYTRCSDGFGYENKFTPAVNRLQPDQFLPKEEILVTSPIHKNGMYCQGVNANVAFMTTDDTIEDAMAISRSLAEKMTTTEIHQVNIIVPKDMHPINLYGDEVEFKFLPDIGDYVNDRGILCAFRPVTDETFIADTMARELGSVHYLHDTIYYAPPGAKILDLDFYVSKSTKMPKTIYEQVDKYRECIEAYYLKIVEVYNKYRNQFTISPEFNTLVTGAMAKLTAARIKADGVPLQPKAHLLNRHNRPIEFLHITITYMSKRKCGNGYKVTGRDGAMH